MAYDGLSQELAHRPHKLCSTHGCTLDWVCAEETGWAGGLWHQVEPLLRLCTAPSLHREGQKPFELHKGTTCLLS